MPKFLTGAQKLGVHCDEACHRLEPCAIAGAYVGDGATEVDDGVSEGERVRRYASEPEVFLEVVERLRGVPIGINFDVANPVMVGYDPMTILRAVADRVWHVHVSDRKVGEETHQVLGEGDVPLESLLTKLAGIGYRGVLSLEDGQGQGDEGTRKSLVYLRALVQQCWAT